MIRRTLQHSKDATYIIVGGNVPDAGERLGMAFCIDDRGLFLTAAHCVVTMRAYARCWLVCIGRRTLPDVTVAAEFTDADIALLRAPGAGLAVFDLDMAAPEEGTPIYTLGMSAAHVAISASIVASVTPIGNVFHCTKDAALTPGYSGAPIVSTETGKAIGVAIGSQRPTFEHIDSANPLHVHGQHSAFSPLANVRNSLPYVLHQYRADAAT